MPDSPVLLLRADDVPARRDRARSPFPWSARSSEKRSTWRHWNLWAEASRQTMGWRFATAEDREAVVGMIVDAAEAGVARAHAARAGDQSPSVFRRADGTSRVPATHSVVFTSEELLAAEDRLLRPLGGPSRAAVDLDVIERVDRGKEHLLSAEQAATLASIAVSGRQVDLLVGPAGAGKTTAMRALQPPGRRSHGKDSVVGLAPSAAAAQVLAEDSASRARTPPSGCTSTTGDGRSSAKGQLVIIDEATLAGTLTLDRLTALAAEAGAKVLLVGDWAQLQSVDAGGAFALLASARADTPS